MKVNFNVPVYNLDNQPIMEGSEPTNIGRILGNILVMTSKGDVLKFYGWAMKMNNKEEIDLDKSDQVTLRKFVEDSDSLPILTKAQIFNLLDKKETE